MSKNINFSLENKKTNYNVHIENLFYDCCFNNNINIAKWFIDNNYVNKNHILNVLYYYYHNFDHNELLKLYNKLDYDIIDLTGNNNRIFYNNIRIKIVPLKTDFFLTRKTKELITNKLNVREGTIIEKKIVSFYNLCDTDSFITAGLLYEEIKDQIDIFTMFVENCKNNDGYKISKFLYEYTKQIDIRSALFMICDKKGPYKKHNNCGKIETIISILEAHEYTIRDFLANEEMAEIFTGVCVNDKLDTAKKFYESYKDLINEHIDYTNLFIDCCLFCKIDTVKWIYLIGESKIDVHFGNELAFRSSITNKRLETAKWLYKISKNKINIHQESTLYRPIKISLNNLDIETIEWLLEIENDYNVLFKNIKIYYYFEYACLNNKPEIAELLIKIDGENIIKKINKETNISFSELKKVNIIEKIFSSCNKNTIIYIYELLNKHSNNFIMLNKQQLFVKSCLNGNLKAAKFILKLGSINIIPEYVPGIYKNTFERYPDIFKWLISLL